jgi:proline iminopeptidase
VIPSRRVGPVLALLLVVSVSTASAQDASFERAGVMLHYRTIGDGPPAILLSGGPGFNVDYMAPVADALPASYQKVLFEQRGTGRSVAPMTPEAMTLRTVVEDLDALRVHLKQDRLLLVGHSWGGMLAMAYASAYPERVDRLILIGSGGPTLEFYSWFGDNINARLRPEDIEAQRYWTEAVKRGVDVNKVTIESVRAVTPGYFFDRAKGLAFASQLKDGTLNRQVNVLLFGDMAKEYDLRPGLRRLNRPVLIVQGHQDPIGDKTAEEIHATIGGSVLAYLNKCGHFPWIEQPDDFRTAIANFLK